MTTFNLARMGATGLEIGQSITNFSSIECALAVNTPGTLNVRFPDQGYSSRSFPRDARFELWRKPTGAKAYHRVGRTAWFLRKLLKFVDPIANKTEWEIQAESGLGILARRIVYYRRGTTWADKTIADGNSGPADDLMKEYVREAFTVPVLDGPGTPDTDRVVTSTYMVVAADTGEGPTMEKQAAFRNILSVVQELASDSAQQGTNLFFDMITHGLNLEFRTWSGARGSDLTDRIIFSPMLSNITDVRMEWDYAAEKNAALIGGDESDTSRTMAEVVDTSSTVLSPWNRNEVFVDARNIGVTTVLEEEGNIVLGKFTPKIRIEAKPINGPGVTYGKNYFFGDLVRVSVDDQQFDCTVDTVSLRLQEGVEEVDITLSGETAL